MNEDIIVNLIGELNRITALQQQFDNSLRNLRDLNDTDKCFIETIDRTIKENERNIEYNSRFRRELEKMQSLSMECVYAPPQQMGERIKSLLDEIRITAQKYKEKILNAKPVNEEDLKRAESIIRFFSNADYVVNASGGLVKFYLECIGYENEEKTYEELMKELTKEYEIINPEDLYEALNRGK